MNNLLSTRRLLLIAALMLIIAVLAYALIQNQTPKTQSNLINRPTVNFNFDSGSNSNLNAEQGTPFSQTSNGITAYFSSPSDPATFTIQNQDTTSLKLSQFSGKYLYDNNTSRDILDIKFSTKIVAINLTFATVEHQSEIIPEPSNIALIAYTNASIAGSNSVNGQFTSDSYPQGILSFSSGQPFDWVRISIPAQASGTTDFMIDNITITTLPFSGQ